MSRKELEYTEKEEREENLRTHLGELQHQLREMENLQGQVREMKDRLRNAQRQLAEREVESANLMQQVAILGINWSHSSATISSTIKDQSWGWRLGRGI